MRPALLLLLGGCLNVPAFGGDGGAHDGPGPVGAIDVHVGTRQLASATILVPAATIIGVLSNGEALPPVSPDETGKAELSVDDGATVFVSVPPTAGENERLVVFADVKRGDSLTVGLPLPIEEHLTAVDLVVDPNAAGSITLQAACFDVGLTVASPAQTLVGATLPLASCMTANMIGAIYFETPTAMGPDLMAVLPGPIDASNTPAKITYDASAVSTGTAFGAMVMLSDGATWNSGSVAGTVGGVHGPEEKLVVASGSATSFSTTGAYVTIDPFVEVFGDFRNAATGEADSFVWARFAAPTPAVSIDATEAMGALQIASPIHDTAAGDTIHVTLPGAGTSSTIVADMVDTDGATLREVRWIAPVSALVRDGADATLSLPVPTALADKVLGGTDGSHPVSTRVRSLRFRSTGGDLSYDQVRAFMDLDLSNDTYFGPLGVPDLNRCDQANG
ncbi:MAG TPA: hypothetical protein VGM88_31030 [Kofleriaceae bacterium]|jgi:hypothetical protein